MKPLKNYAIVYAKVPDLAITTIKAENRKAAFKVFTDRYKVIEVEGDTL